MADLEENSLITLNNGSSMYVNSALIDFGADAKIIVNSGAKLHLNGSTFDGSIGSNIEVKNGGELKILGSVALENTSITVESGGNLITENNSVLTTNGTGSLVYINSGSNVSIGNNSAININNLAKIWATNISFIASSSWNGFTMDDAGSCVFIGCTFSNSRNPLSFYNTSTSADIPKAVKSCILNIPNGTGTSNAIYAENIRRFIIDGNIFNLVSGSSGLFTKNYLVEGDGLPSIFDLKVVNNTFNNGQYQTFLWSNTSEYLPYYIYNNTFKGSTPYKFAGRRLLGATFKKNKIEGTSTSAGLTLWESNVHLLDNILSTQGNTIVLNTSYPLLAPLKNQNNQLIWYGGRNQITSTQNNGIYVSSGYPITDLGLNTHTFQNSSKYHIEGYLPDTVTQYYWCRNNCWVGNGEIPKINLHNNVLSPIPPYFAGLTCREDHTLISAGVVDLGDGIYDTTHVTDDLSDTSATQDVLLYSQGQEYQDEADFPSAINQYKSLIANFHFSPYSYSAVYDLYDCYYPLDTSGIQSVTDELFGDLRLFLQNLIQSDSYDQEFVDIAYNTILMCEVIMKDLEVALTGYEFIATYHPDPETRLLASMDYSDIEAIMNQGQGGGMSNKAKKESIKKLSDRDPLIRKLKTHYQKTEKDQAKKLSGEKKRASKEIDDNVQKHIIRNLSRSVSLTPEEKKNQEREDIAMLLEITNMKSEMKDEMTTSIPKQLELSQNYPNPFNPTTTINYAIPKDMMVKIKVYDISGREITSLVNELKQAGNHSVSFNGHNLASGVYLYKIEVGDFVQTKKMLLIK